MRYWFRIQHGRRVIEFRRVSADNVLQAFEFVRGRYPAARLSVVEYRTVQRYRAAAQYRLNSAAA